MSGDDSVSSLTLEALSLFLCGYLNQDWDLDYPDEQHALADFTAMEPVASKLVQEIDALLAQRPTEEQLYRLFAYDLHSSYFPDPDAGSAAEWLGMIRDYVQRELPGTSD